MTSGERVGPYTIGAPIGEGGMGRVFRATDTSLGRQVAIKILPETFASDPDRLARFEREARILASLNHPNIAQIYGLQRRDGTGPLLVMELVEGEDLAQRIARGAMPLEDALPIARQIAEALEAAHDQGIVHRDLKPANIRIRPDGTVKVLDFGLARPVGPEARSHAGGVFQADLTNSPTITSPAALTGTGVILGTAAYMAPEQARGKVVDKRVDIWAFGTVFYEMLTGARAFSGEDVADTVANVLRMEPDWGRLRVDTPASARRLLRRCLVKDPRKRLRDIGDARIELDEQAEPALEARTVAAGRTATLRGVVGLVLVAAMAGLIGWYLQPSEIPTVTRFSHVLPEDVRFSGGGRSLVAISPDGASIVYVGNNQLYRRSFNELDAAPIRGTEGAPSAPFLSPDGQSVGYWDLAAEELRRIALAGGTPLPLTSATAVYGASWEADGSILYGQVDGIWRVSEDGGTPEHLVPIEPTELAYGPRMLPGGNAVLFSLVTRAAMIGQSTAWDTASVIVQSLDANERRQVVNGSDARVLASGHLVFARDRVLFAMPFDLASRKVRGTPVPVVEGVQRGVRGSGGQGGSAYYDVSAQGHLVYVPAFFGDGAYVPRRLLAVDFLGNAEVLTDAQQNYWRPRVSADGDRVAVEVQDQGLGFSQTWIVDLQRGASSPLTVDGESAYPVWSADGESVLYRGRHGDVVGIYQQAADGSGEARLVFEPQGTPEDVSSDGIVAVKVGVSPETDIRTVPLAGGTPSDFLATQATEAMAAFSPDGRWIAYASNESGQDEVYVRPFPRAEGVPRRVSVGGGTGPVWAPDGSALYYRGASGELMALPTTLSPGFTPGRPRPLFRFAGIYRMSGTARAYDIHPDGRRFIMVSEESSPAQPRQQVNVVFNWTDELKRLVPTN